MGYAVRRHCCYCNAQLLWSGAILRLNKSCMSWRDKQLINMRLLPRILSCLRILKFDEDWASNIYRPPNNSTWWDLPISLTELDQKRSTSCSRTALQFPIPLHRASTYVHALLANSERSKTQTNKLQRPERSSFARSPKGFVRTVVSCVPLV